ncbi:hypothetical protein KR074_004460 [Drosophila pseudoananassae]|nr:hypothetical protein KR074_004460 [Drosophila pseudoananassae]
MSRFLAFLGVFLLLAVAVENSLSPNMHYHRYMLSDYKPQHNPKTQKDYKQIKMRSPAKAEDKEHVEHVAPEHVAARSKEPVIRLTQGDHKLQLHELIVRIYRDNHFVCTGTIISDMLVATVDTCFPHHRFDHLTVRNFQNEIYDGKRVNSSETFLKSEDPYLDVIMLDRPFVSPNITGDTVKLCDTEVQDHAIVELPIWIRQRHSVHSQKTEVWPLQECRHRMKDEEGVLAQDNMICVKNQQYTKQCQHGNGNPLVYDGMICGINVYGHNCPHHTGFDLYISIYDALSFSIAGMELIKHNKVQEAIL